MKTRKYYVYVITLDNLVFYVGKGCGNRVYSKKNDYFNALDSRISFDRQIVKKGLTNKQAETLESKLIKKYNSPTNIQQGLTVQKYVPLSKDTIESLQEANKVSKVGEQCATPDELAKLLIDSININATRILIPEDRYGVLTKYARNRFPDSFITVYETNKDRLTDLGENSDCIMTMNFLTAKIEDDFDCIIMNPPFKDQEKFMNKCMKITKNIAAVLQRKWSRNIETNRSGSSIYKLYLNNLVYVYQVDYKSFISSGSPTDLAIFSEYSAAEYTLSLGDHLDRCTYVCEKVKYPKAYPCIPPERYDYYFDQQATMKSKRVYAKNSFIDLSSDTKVYAKRSVRKNSLSGIDTYSKELVEYTITKGSKNAVLKRMKEFNEEYGSKAIDLTSYTGFRGVELPPIRQ